MRSKTEKRYDFSENVGYTFYRVFQREILREKGAPDMTFIPKPHEIYKHLRETFIRLLR